MANVAVPVALRQRLEAARERNDDFASAWHPALAAALDGLPRWDAEAWQNCLTETVDSWRSAFERRGAGPLAAALGTLGADRVAGTDGRECARPSCSNDLPPDAHGCARYCSDACNAAMRRERENARVPAVA